MANALTGDFPSPWLTLVLKGSGNCISIAICMLLYMIVYVVANIKIKLSKQDVPQWTQYQRKAWIMLLNIGAVYLYNRVSVATAIILWFATIAHIGAIVLCILPAEKRDKFYRYVYLAAIGFSLLNWLIHWLTRTFTSLATSVATA
jgi:hypothetical protein